MILQTIVLPKDGALLQQVLRKMQWKDKLCSHKFIWYTVVNSISFIYLYTCLLKCSHKELDLFFVHSSHFLKQLMYYYQNGCYDKDHISKLMIQPCLLLCTTELTMLLNLCSRWFWTVAGNICDAHLLLVGSLMNPYIVQILGS